MALPSRPRNRGGSPCPTIRPISAHRHTDSLHGSPERIQLLPAGSCRRSRSRRRRSAPARSTTAPTTRTPAPHPTAARAPPRFRPTPPTPRTACRDRRPSPSDTSIAAVACESHRLGDGVARLRQEIAAEQMVLVLVVELPLPRRLHHIAQLEPERRVADGAGDDDHVAHAGTAAPDHGPRRHRAELL